MRYNVTRNEAVERIANRTEFRVRSGSLSGREQNPGPVHYYSSAFLTKREQARLADVTTCDYTVFSYDTPIAWHDADGWHVFDRSFTPTTNARHLPVIRKALGASWHYDYDTRELVQDSPALYVAESVNAYDLTVRQGDVLRSVQYAVSAGPELATQWGRQLPSVLRLSDWEPRMRAVVRRVVDKGYLTLTGDTLSVTDKGMRAYV